RAPLCSKIFSCEQAARFGSLRISMKRFCGTYGLLPRVLHSGAVMRLRQSRHERGFSLIELMIVIAIIGILIGVGVPTWRLMVRRGNETAAIQTIDTIKKLEADYALGHRGEFGTLEELVKEGGGLDSNRVGGERPSANG